MSNGIIAPTKEEIKELKPSDFPPVLRSLTQYLMENPAKYTMPELCERTNTNLDSVYRTIRRYKKKGKNFYDLMADISYQALKDNRYHVDGAVLERASSGSHRDAELFYKRLRTPGFTDPKTEINVNIAQNFSTIVCPSGPPDLEPIETVNTEEEESKDN